MDKKTQPSVLYSTIKLLNSTANMYGIDIHPRQNVVWRSYLKNKGF